MKHKFKFILVLLLFFHGLTKAQERLIQKGNEKFYSYSFSPAIDIYKKVLDKGFVSADLLRKLGNSYYYNADYKEAAQTYKQLVADYSAEVTAEDYFKYAQSLKTLGDYNASSDVMNKFMEITKSDGRAAAFNEDRDFMSEIEENSGRYNLGPFEYNSPYSDFAPSFYKEGLIFSSDRDTGNFARYRHTWNAKDFLDLYEVNADSSSVYHVKKLDENVNTRYHESTSVVTKDGQTMYFTRNNSERRKTIKDDKGIVRLKVLRAVLTDEGIWGEVEELPFNSDSYSVANPALSPDEKTLYFVSDMPGTLGESDLFMVSINEDRSFGTPQNLGSNINTEARETFPYITSEEILYFSSDGHPGLGGLDVFATKIKRQDFTGKVLNVGKPVNSN
ncbi:MAG: flagellar motor protein MotB, partial [Maribacter sp.]